MRIITLNVNGLRAAERKGLARWLARAEPWDVRPCQPPAWVLTIGTQAPEFSRAGGVRGKGQ